MDFTNNKIKIFYKSLVVAMKDAPGVEKDPRVIKISEAKKYNEMGYGIFVTINGFEGRRIKENLVTVNAWAIDLDFGTKQEQKDCILESPLKPTMIVESKNGFHVWWAAIDGTKENYEEIVANRLVPFFGADNNAKDICRLLRVPQYYHLKDPANPFLVETVYFHNRAYTEKEMLSSFPAVKKSERNVTKNAAPYITRPGEEIDCKQALMSLSGTHWVNGDVYTFKRNGNGTEQIWVNGKSSPCWIDNKGLIGSLDKGGPTINQWLRWYYGDYQKVREIMKKHFGR